MTIVLVVVAGWVVLMILGLALAAAAGRRAPVPAPSPVTARTAEVSEARFERHQFQWV